MEMQDYNLTCGEVIDNLLTLADAYEKASAGKAPNGFAFSPTDAAANMKAAVHFIGSFGQQLPLWVPVEDRLPDKGVDVLVASPCPNSNVPNIDIASWGSEGEQEPVWRDSDCGRIYPTHWMPLPEPPEVT